MYSYRNFKSFIICIERSTLIGQRPMKSLSSACPSVHLSFRPSLSFLKIGSLVSSDIVHDDSWSWYLVTDKARFLKKQFRPNGPKSGPKWGFSPFYWVWIIFFPSRSKTLEKKILRPRFGKRAKIESEIRFSAILSSLVH